MQQGAGVGPRPDTAAPAVWGFSRWLCAPLHSALFFAHHAAWQTELCISKNPRSLSASSPPWWLTAPSCTHMSGQDRGFFLRKTCMQTPGFKPGTFLLWGIRANHCQLIIILILSLKTYEEDTDNGSVATLNLNYYLHVHIALGLSWSDWYRPNISHKTTIELYQAASTSSPLF